MCANRKTRWRRFHRTFTCIGLAALAALAHVSRASAERAPRLAVDATWDAPAGCPTQSDVMAQIDELVSESTLTSATPLVARATVTERLGRFQLDMHIDAPGASKSKTIDAEHCFALAQAYAFIVAFTLDPSAGMQKSAPPVLASAAPAPEASAPSYAEAKLPSPAFDLAIGPFAVLGVGLLPSPALGLGGRVALGVVPRWEISGTYWPERRAAVSALSSSSAVGGDVSLATATFSACLPLRATPLEACAGADVGGMRAGAAGVPVLASGTSWWLAPTAALAARLRVTHALALCLRLGVGVPLFRPRFVLEDVGAGGPVEAYRPAPAFGVLALEPELRFFSTD